MTIDGGSLPNSNQLLDAFAANFAERGEVGAAVCVYVDGRPVVDLWGGIADATTGREWEEDAIVLVYSSTKGVTSCVRNLLIERGQLDPEVRSRSTGRNSRRTAKTRSRRPGAVHQARPAPRRR
jgi:CubicO group peptidase (beta-lactamase class C family)